MRQVAQNFKTGLVSVVDVPEPSVQQGHVLVRNGASVISAGTERQKIDLGKKSLIGKAKARPDLVRQVVGKVRTEGLLATAQTVMTRLDSLSPLGYSTAGEVVAVGRGVEEFKVGDIVACGGAEYAHHAEYVSVPKHLVVPVPVGVDIEHAAFTTVGSIALQGVRQADVRLGERVLVIGLGLIGQLTVQILKAAGCRVAGADVAGYQMDVAAKNGCEIVVNASEDSAASRLKAFTAGEGFDAVIVTAAAHDNTPFLLAGDVARDRARVVVVGAVPISLPRSPAYEKELSVSLSRSYGPGRYDPRYEVHGIDYPIGYVRWTENRNMRAFLDLVASGAIDVACTMSHTFDIEEAPRAYGLLTEGAEPYLGVVLRYSSCSRQRPPAPDVTPIGRRSATGTADAVGIALVGAGNFATKTLIPGIRRTDAHLVTVVSARGLSAKDAADRFRFSHADSTVDQAFVRDGVTAALIATRHDSHAQLVVAALRRGLHVFVEKPLATSPEDLCAVEAAKAESESVVMVGFNRRFAPFSGELKTLRMSHDSPAQLMIRVNAGAISASSWIQDLEIGGGRVVGEACHFIDLAVYLAGSRVTDVAARSLGSDRSPESSDSLTALLTHEDGSLTTLVYSSVGDASYPKERIELLVGGDIGVIDDYRQLTVLHGGKRRVVKRAQDKGHRHELEEFVEACKAGKNPAAMSFEDCTHTTRVSFAVIDALRAGERHTLEDGRLHGGAA